MNPQHIVIGLIVTATGDCLIAKRPAHVHLGGLWEFPGGKCEPGESPEMALRRELMEELGIEITVFEPFLQFTQEYDDRHLVLDSYLVTDFTGTARSAEGQPIKWVQINRLDEYSFPIGNLTFIEKLQNHQKHLQAITN